MPEAPIRVVLADDHTMLREGLRRSLAALGIDVVGEAGDGLQALDMISQHSPDVVLMDVTMPVLDGIETTRRVRSEHPDVHVVVLSMHADEELRSDALAAGASSYLVKDCATSEIISALHAAVGRVQAEPSTAKVLTQRETEVLQLIANGMGTAEAAAALFVSLKTVKNHLASAYGKLETHDRTQAVVKAARLGIITIPH